jgi:galactokinase
MARVTDDRRDEGEARRSPESVARRFRTAFGDAELRLYRAPGRVNLIGEHTDYNDGFVLPAAIDLAAWVAAAPRTDRTLRIVAADLGRRAERSLDEHDPSPARDWSDYVFGVALELERAGHRLRGADLLVTSDVPVGAGMSSSAALEVAVALALLDLAGHAVDPVAVARLCQAAENRFVGTRCGIMDQFASCCGRAGHALFLDCRSLAVEEVAMPDDVAILVCDSRVSHALAEGAYNERRASCEGAVRILGHGRPEIRALRDVRPDELKLLLDELPDDVLRRRCRHVVTENARVGDAVKALQVGDLPRLGALLRASHESLRRDYEVSCEELDFLVEAASGCAGVHGSRLMGGGFGGSTISLVRPDAVPDVAAVLRESYRGRYGRPPGLHVCRPAHGARRVC